HRGRVLGWNGLSGGASLIGPDACLLFGLLSQLGEQRAAVRRSLRAGDHPIQECGLLFLRPAVERAHGEIHSAARAQNDLIFCGASCSAAWACRASTSTSSLANELNA